MKTETVNLIKANIPKSSNKRTEITYPIDTCIFGNTNGILYIGTHSIVLKEGYTCKLNHNGIWEIVRDE